MHAKSKRAPPHTHTEICLTGMIDCLIDFVDELLKGGDFPARRTMNHAESVDKERNNRKRW